MVSIVLLVLSQPYNLNLQPPQFYNCTGSVSCFRTGPWLNINGTGGGGGGGGGAPVDGGFVVWTSVGSSNERVLTAGTNITLSTSTPGQLIVNASGGGGGWAPDGGTLRLVLTQNVGAVTTSSTAVELVQLRYDAGVVGSHFTYRCNISTLTDGGTANGIRLNTDFLGMAGSTVNSTAMVYCSSATAASVIGGGTSTGVTYQPTASQGNVPCEYTFARHVSNVAAVGQVRVFLYSELGGVAGVLAHAGSYCDVNHW